MTGLSHGETEERVGAKMGRKGWDGREKEREGSRNDRVKDGKDRGSESDKERHRGREKEPQ